MTTLLLLAVLSGPTEYTFQLLPPGQDVTLRTGERARAYLLDDYLKLIEYDDELVKLRASATDLKVTIGKLEERLKLKEEMIVLLTEDKEILRTRGNRLEKSWHKCEKDLVASAGGPIWPYVVGIAGAVVGIVGTTAYLVERAK